MRGTKCVVLLGIMIVVGLMLWAAWPVAFAGHNGIGGAGEPYGLAGLWLQTSDAFGDQVFTVIPIDPAGRKLVAMSAELPLDMTSGLFPEVVEQSQARAICEKTGPGLYDLTLYLVGYDAEEQTVYTMVLAGDVTMTGPDSYIARWTADFRGVDGTSICWGPMIETGIRLGIEPPCMELPPLP